MLNSSLQVFCYPVDHTMFFITAASKTTPINNIKHFKHNTEITPAPTSFRNKLDNIQHKVTNLNFNLNFSTKPYIPSRHSPPSIDVPFTFQWTYRSKLVFKGHEVSYSNND